MLAAALAAALVVGASTPAPRPPDGTYTYTITVADKPVGTSIIAIDGTQPGALTVKEQVQLTVASFAATATTRYDPATLRQTGYSMDVISNGNTSHVDVTTKPGAMSVTMGAVNEDIVADSAAPLEIIGDDLAGSAVLIPALLHTTGATALTIAAITEGKAYVAHAVTEASAARPAGVPANDVDLVLDLSGFSGVREYYWYDPQTFVVQAVVVPAQHAVFRLVSTAPLHR